MLKRRLIYTIGGAMSVALGLASRRYPDVLPPFVALYAGDALWALMAFLLLSAAVHGTELRYRIVITVALCFAVETSQLYHAPWIDSIRRTRLGGLLLGFHFRWSDLVCYAAGVAAGAAIEAVLVPNSDAVVESID